MRFEKLAGAAAAIGFAALVWASVLPASSLADAKTAAGHGGKPRARVFPGTDADLVSLLLPHIDVGWRSP